ncbi:MAG: response regulator [Alphaproteobacteria bacterium]|nr:response regulator [Rhodospirillales bacterium]MCW9045840.1 response regulator [Alphaproteobacteria bacterium]
MNFDLEKALAKLKQEFIESSGDRLDEIDAAIDRIFKETGDREADYFQMQRDIHSIKGSAGTHGFNAVTVIAHRVEDYIESTRRLTKTQLQDVQVYVDRIREIMEAGKDPSESELNKILHGLPSSTQQATVSEQEVKNLTVLLVMPKGVQRKLIGTELASCGFEISFSENPVEAISLALSIKPDIIVSSTEFEEMTGIELANVFKAIKITREMNFVLTTSHDDGDPALSELPEGTSIIHKSGDFAEELTECLINMGVFGKV